MPPREVLEWTPPVFALIQGELQGWRYRPEKTAEEGAEHLLSALYRAGYTILKVDGEDS